MCGIAGLWTRKGWSEPELRETVERMLKPINQRGPDGQGLWLSSKWQIALGHRRLSILDLSEAAAQPMVEAQPGDGVAITFNGEIYNFRELRRELEGLGVSFHSTSDTEVILKGYQVWGEETFKRLSGIFAFGLLDLNTRELFLARDAIGIKPLYVCHGDFGVAFASTPSQFLAAGLAGEINPEALAYYLRWGYIEVPGSIYCNVNQVPPGEYWKIRVQADSACSRHSIFKHPNLAPKGGSTGRTGGQDFGDLLDQVVKEQLVSDVPLGCFLSGGIDSTAVATAMSRTSPEPVKTFTVGFPGWEDDEAPIARRTAHILGTQHRELNITGPEALKALPEVFDAFDEPFADASAIPTFLVSRLAREHVTVVLSGDGGDELFGGYRRYGCLRAKRPMIYALPPAWRRWASRWCSSRRRQDLLAVGSLDELYCLQLVQFSPSELSALWPGFQQPPLAMPGVPENGLSPWRRGMVFDFLTYLPGDILVKTDRCTMAVGLEGRVPILDTRIVEYAARLPDNLLCDGARTKAPLRKYLAARIPTDHLDLPKRGFGIPKAAWLRTELKQYLGDMLHSDIWDPLGVFSRAYTQQLFQEHLAGGANHADKLWTILALAEWNMRRLGGCNHRKG